jgi:hypothetical protein
MHENSESCFAKQGHQAETEKGAANQIVRPKSAPCRLKSIL